MAQQKMGQVIALSCFAVVTVIAVTFLYFTITDNGLKEAEIAKAQADLRTSEDTRRDLLQQVDVLKNLIGKDGEVGPGSTDPNTINGSVQQLLASEAGDGTSAALNLEGAVRKATTDRDTERYAAEERLANFNQKARDLQNTIVSKDAEIATHRDAREAAEQELRRKETLHSEELAQKDMQFDELKQQLLTVQSEYDSYKQQASRLIQDLEQDNGDKRKALVNLRQQLFQKDDLGFSKPDGLITFVDRNQRICYVNLGTRDALRVGTTFSVYSQANNGIGRRNTEDIKGAIEVVEILGPHRAEARIIEEDNNRPLAIDDPVFSPVFSSGIKMEIALVGMVDFDGTDGSDRDREEFHRLVRAAGAKIVVEVDRAGQFVDSDGNVINASQAEELQSHKTRFLVKGDTGDLSKVQDPAIRKLYEQIHKSTAVLEEDAIEHGIYEIGLSTFLEHIGYSRKQIAWTPEQVTFPGKLANGARSDSVGATFGNRASSAVISGAFSGRSQPTTSSTGTTSGSFK
jgi:hypothetical protein